MLPAGRTDNVLVRVARPRGLHGLRRPGRRDVDWRASGAPPEPPRPVRTMAALHADNQKERAMSRTRRISELVLPAALSGLAPRDPLAAGKGDP